MADSKLAGAGQGAAAGASAGAALGPWGALAGGVIGAGAGLFLAGRGAAARKRASLEELRRRDVRSATTLGAGIVAAGASGIEFNGLDPRGGSMQAYLADMSTEFRAQHDRALGQIREGEKLENLTSGLSAATSIGSSLFKFGAANNWWQGGPTVR
jgi:hypothetical protein